jgi:anti-sigma regulatory factor (Ser/Thr protein kinase)
MSKVYHVGKYDFENAGKASTDIKRFLKKRGVSPQLIRRVAVAAYELEMNQVVHSEGGTVRCRVEPEYTEITAQDTGPGIDNVEESMKEGVTTANEWIQSMGFGAGMGLPNARRVADRFHIESSPEHGTKVQVYISLQPKEEEK